MKKLMNKHILVALTAFFIAWTLTAGLAYGATVFTKSLNASVKVVADVNFEFYSDKAATQVLTRIDLPDASPGSTTISTFYLKNTSPITERISAGPNSVQQSLGTLTLTFDGQAQKDLAPGEVCKVVMTLIISSNADSGPINFSFSVNAVPATTGPVPPVLNGQQLFNANCITCHASGAPNTNRTESQLITFIANHKIGTSLTPEEVAAIASFIKQ